MKYICQRCGDKCKSIRIDLELPKHKRQWICEKCHWNKKKKK